MQKENTYSKYAKQKAYSPSRFVAYWVDQLVENISGPVIDVGCGYGRNALEFARHGMDVECLDIDNVALKYIEQQATRDQLQGIKTRLIDFDNDRWCYAHETVGAVINVDYFSRNLMDKFNRSVRVGGYVLFETISGRGGNYLELPDEKEVSACFGDHFEFLYYCEKKVGPSSCKAVTVKMVAKKKSVS